MSQTQGQPGMGGWQPSMGMTRADQMAVDARNQQVMGSGAPLISWNTPTDAANYQPGGWQPAMNWLNALQHPSMQPQPWQQQGYGPGGSQAGIAAQRDQILADQGGGDITSLVGRVAQNQPQMGGNAMMSQGRK